MAMNVTGFVALGVALIFFVAAYRYAAKCSLKARALLLVLCGLLSVPSVLVAIYYLNIRSETEWFYEMRALPGAEFFIIFPGCAAGCFAAFLPRVLLAFPLFAFMLLGVVPYLKPFLGPLDMGLLEDRWDGRACLQSTSSTCGPASICSILAALGVPSVEREAASAAYSYVGGTEAWYLARYIRGKGLKAGFEFRNAFKPSVEFPAMVGVKVGGMGHFIAVLEVKDDYVTFIDPLVGEQRVTLAQFLKRYSFSGFHMTVGKR